jgi:hypothetical protein
MATQISGWPFLVVQELHELFITAIWYLSKISRTTYVIVSRSYKNRKTASVYRKLYKNKPNNKLNSFLPC